MCWVLGPLLLHYNEGVDEKTRWKYFALYSFLMVLIDDWPAFQMVLTDVQG